MSHTPPVDSKGAKIKHLDLFSGIGGFAYAADQVFGEVKHIFCDNDKFCQQVLNKHWPEAKIYNDIKDITDTEGWWQRRGKQQRPVKQEASAGNSSGVFLLTGGFPCQPYSQAGLRKGTADSRHLWPEMLRVIRLTKPEWVIAENVRGLLNWNEGVVFEQVCLDLENEGYEVQPFIIPAGAINAPHRRDRIWFVAHALNGRQGQEKRQSPRTSQTVPKEHRPQDSTARKPSRANNYRRFNTSDWSKDWFEVATHASRVDDGLPNRVDRLKSLGNAIVPQVAIEIMRGILPPLERQTNE